MKRTHSLWTMGLAGALLTGCQPSRMTSTQHASAYPPPMTSRLRIKTESVPHGYAATSPAPTAQATGVQAPAAQPPVTQGFVTETPLPSVPHGTTPLNSRPTEAAYPEDVQPVQTPAARPTTLPAARQPAATPATQPSETPTLPPPPVPSSRVTPGTSKGHVDPNTPETIIVMSQTDSNANQTLMLVNNKTRPAPAPAVNAAHSAPKEGVCTITGEAQQFRRTWRLRYAPLDSEDSHGGSVMLLGEGLNRIREGQQIRVVGTMQPAEERGDAPRFHVQFLEVLSR